jgi:Tfp pilus assembly protein PilW
MKNFILKIENSQVGMTLIELLIYMGLLSIFLVVLTSVFTSIVNVQLESKSVSSVEEDGRYILNRLTYDIRRASSITTPASIGGSGSTLALVINGSTYTLSQNGNNLQLVSSAGTDNLNSVDTKISNLSFQRIGNVSGKNTIVINFTITSAIQKMGNGPETKAVQTTIGIR